MLSALFPSIPNIRDVLANYRTVSGLSLLSKTLERLVLSQLNYHIAAFDLLSPCQSAYRAHHSTETALLSVTDDHLQAIDGGCGKALLLLDLSAAFDTIDYATLTDRLSVSFGLSRDGSQLVFFLPQRNKTVCCDQRRLLA